MNAVTQLDDTSLESTLAHYDIGSLVRFWPAANGIENSWVADSRARVLVLTQELQYGGQTDMSTIEGS